MTALQLHVIGTLHFHVAGTPRPQSRPRFVRGRVVSSPSRLLKLWRTLMLAAFMKGRPFDGPLREPVIVDCIAMFACKNAKKWGTPHVVRPDKDNLEKAVLDCLVKAGVLKDDSLVCDGSFRKIWAERGALDVSIRLASTCARKDETPRAVS
jgi:Holliday junction resolvase RusA-like endonuclease